jgi:hypothetical protein
VELISKDDTTNYKVYLINCVKNILVLSLIQNSQDKIQAYVEEREHINPQRINESVTQFLLQIIPVVTGCEHLSSESLEKILANVLSCYTKINMNLNRLIEVVSVKLIRVLARRQKKSTKKFVYFCPPESGQSNWNVLENFFAIAGDLLFGDDQSLAKALDGHKSLREFYEFYREDLSNFHPETRYLFLFKCIGLLTCCSQISFTSFL